MMNICYVACRQMDMRGTYHESIVISKRYFPMWNDNQSPLRSHGLAYSRVIKPMDASLSTNNKCSSTRHPRQRRKQDLIMKISSSLASQLLHSGSLH